MDRYRSETVNASTEDYRLESYYLSGGSCTSVPSVKTIWGGEIQYNGINNDIMHFRDMTDVVTPEFRKLSGSGRIINNPMTQSEVRESSELVNLTASYMNHLWSSTYERWCPQNEHFCEGTFPLTRLPGIDFQDPEEDYDKDALEERVITKAFSRIGHDNMLALATVAETKDSIKGLKFLLQKVYNICMYVKTARLRKLAGELSPKELSEVYMNARYNLRPLYYDVKGITKTLSKVKETPKRQTFRAQEVVTSRTSDTKDFVLYNHSGANSYIIHGTVKRSSELIVTCRGGVLTSANPFNRFQGFGLDKFAETAWDLLPFSFIVDWFCNMGDVVGAWSPKFGFQTLTSWAVTDEVATQVLDLVDLTYTCNGYPDRYYLPGPFSWSGGTMERVTRLKTRTPSVTRAILPSIDLNLDSLKVLDLAIIAKSIRGKRSQWFRD